MAASWFPVGKNDEGGWRLDIVSLLAVIGESSMEEHAQALTSSWTCILPRIIPAPQALLKPNRPSRMPQVNAIVVGVHSGTKVETLNYFPNIIHSIEDMPAYSFQVWEIKHKNREEIAPEEKSRAILEVNVDERDPENGPGLQKPSAPNGGLIRRATKRITGLSNKSRNSNGTYQAEEKPKEKPHVPAAFYSPLNILAVISSALTFGLLGWAIHEKDGTAILALATISLVSSMVGLASWWQPALMMRNAAVAVPRGDVVIRTREGAFIVVKCNEFVARELYTGSEECEYIIKQKAIYRGLVGIATFLLMVSVVLLGNCNWTMQAAIGSSYIVLNGAYWLTSLFEKHRFWDLKHYEYKNITPAYAKEAHEPQGDSDEEKASYTRTLWYAIRETEKTGWVTKGGASPMTAEWDKWLKEAEEAAKAAAKDAARAGAKEPARPTWPAVRRKNEIVGTHTDAPQQQQHRRQSHAPSSPSTDKRQEELPTTDQTENQAKQQAPALTIPPQPTK